MFMPFILENPHLDIVLQAEVTVSVKSMKEHAWCVPGVAGWPGEARVESARQRGAGGKPRERGE